MEHPNGDWDWKELSVHPNITWEIVKRYPQFESKWKYKQMAKNPNITREIIQYNREFDNPKSLLNFKLYNPNTSFRSLAETYLENIQSISDRKVYDIVKNPVITWDKIQSPEFINLRMNYFENPNCQFERTIIESIRSIEGYDTDEDIFIMKNIDKVVHSNNLDENNPEAWSNFIENDLGIEWIPFAVSENKIVNIGNGFEIFHR